MFFLSDISLSNYARKIGSKDKIPRLKKLRKAILNKDTLATTADGTALGYAVGRVTDTFRKSHSPLGERYGLIAGTTAGLTGSIIHNLRKKNKH